MQDSSDAQNGRLDDEQRKALEALERIVSGDTNDPDGDFEVMGKALINSEERRNKLTLAQMINPKALQAAQGFEDFARENFGECKCSKNFSDTFGTLDYEVIIPRILLREFTAQGVIRRFAEIIAEAETIDIANEDEDSIYFDIVFKVILRF